MYTKQEASAIRQKFWTIFGQYLAPVPSAGGEKVNWVNYKTGVRSVQFKMDVTSTSAYIAIEVSDKDAARQEKLYDHLQSMQNDLNENNSWAWQKHFDQGNKVISRVYRQLPGVSIFLQTDWPAIITFLKSNLVDLDEFWVNQKEILEMIG